MANTEKSGGTAAKGLKAAIVPVTPFQQNCTLIWDPGDHDRAPSSIPAAISTASKRPLPRWG